MAKLTLRLPDDIHRRVQELAEQDDRSLNSELIALLREAINARSQRP